MSKYFIISALLLSTALTCQGAQNLTTEYTPDLKVEFFTDSAKNLPFDKTNGDLVVTIEAEMTDKLVDGVTRQKVVVDGCTKKAGDLTFVELSTKTSRSYVWSAAGGRTYDTIAQDVCRIYGIKIQLDLDAFKKQLPKKHGGSFDPAL